MFENTGSTLMTLSEANVAHVDVDCFQSWAIPIQVYN